MANTAFWSAVQSKGDVPVWQTGKKGGMYGNFEGKSPDLQVNLGQLDCPVLETQKWVDIFYSCSVLTGCVGGWTESRSRL